MFILNKKQQEKGKNEKKYKKMRWKREKSRNQGKSSTKEDKEKPERKGERGEKRVIEKRKESRDCITSRFDRQWQVHNISPLHICYINITEKKSLIITITVTTHIH